MVHKICCEPLEHQILLRRVALAKYMASPIHWLGMQKGEVREGGEVLYVPQTSIASQRICQVVHTAPASCHIESTQP